MHTRTGPSHRMRAKTALLLALAVATVLLAACLEPVGSPAPARATVPGIDSTTLYWDTANRVYYGFYNTPIFTTADSDGNVSFAYCVDPNTTVPAAGSYRTLSVEEFNPGWEAQTRAAMWFGYGGPGFDPSMWPATWNDGSEMGAPQYYAATHLILSYVRSRTMGYVYYNSGTRFMQYAANTFMGINLKGDVVNDQATLFQIFARADEVPDDYNCYFLDSGRPDYVQYIVAQDHYQANGSLAIQKTSLDPSISDTNTNYSLAGAVFGVFADESCTEPFATMTTDESGHAELGGVGAGTYWIKELVAPPGFALDPIAHPLRCLAGRTAVLEVADIPQMDRLPVVVRKVDAETGGAPQADSSLAGAEFEVCFYDGSYQAENLPSQPDRRWVFSTNASGEALLEPGFLVRGDDLYLDAEGVPAIPLGTVTVREIKAPEGYALTDASLHVVGISAGGDAATVSTYVAPVVGDTVTRGSLAIQKVDAETGEPKPQGSASMEAAEFSVVSLNSGPVVVDGITYSPGDVVATLVTDQSGRATTPPGLLPCGTYRVVESKAPSGYLPSDASWDIDVVPDIPLEQAPEPVAAFDGLPRAQGIPIATAGTPRPDIAPAAEGILNILGSLLGQPRVAYAAEVDPSAEAVISEQVIRGGIRAFKVDADTGTGNPQGDASLAGTEFSIVSMNSGPVLVDGVSYPYGTVVKTIYTDEHGMAQTGERDLPYGYYTVEETGAPPGYLRSNQAVQIAQDGVIVEVGKPYENEVKRGGLRVHKTDAELGAERPQGDASLAGATFAIANASEHEVMVDDVSYAPGETVVSIVTDAAGVAQTGPRDLPFGTYTVIETHAPAGYLLGEPIEQLVEIREDGVVHDVEEPVANTVVRGGIALAKKDADTLESAPQGSAALGGATFAIANASEHEVVVNGETYGPGDVVLTVSTNDEGYASTGDRELPYGTYTVTETAASWGYLLNEESRTVTIRDDATVVDLQAPVLEQVQRGGFGIRKLDAETSSAQAQGSASLAGAHYEVVNASDAPVVVRGVVYAPGETVAVLETNKDGWAQTGNHDLPIGTYVVTEVAAPAGYHLGMLDELGEETGDGRSITVTVDGEYSWHSYEDSLYDQVVRGGVSITKVDAELGGRPQGSATLAGARFAVANASNQAVVVGGESYDPGATVAILVTNEEGRASTGPRDLPYGSYTIREIEAPQGYALGSGAQTVVVSEEGTVVEAGQPYANSVIRGGTAVRKTDAEIGSAGPQGSASYQGAVFEIVNHSPQPVVVDGQAHEPGAVVATLVTDASGHAQTERRALPYGTYLVRETQAPRGYLVNDTVWEITVSEDGALLYAGEPVAAVNEGGDTGEPSLLDGFLELFAPSQASASEADARQDLQAEIGIDENGLCIPEQVVRGGLRLQKIDGETGEAVPQGDATLAGATFAITSLNDQTVVVQGTAYKKGDEVMVVRTTEDGIASSGVHELPFGIYAVREIAAPDGYLLNTTPFEQVVSIEDDGALIDLTAPFANLPVRGGLLLHKVDTDTEEGVPLGGASLAGAQFSLVNAGSRAIVYKGVPYEPGELVTTLVTDATGTASTGPRDLPFGTYQVAETRAPEGYLLDPANTQLVTIARDGETEACATAFGDHVCRGDVEGVKVEDGTMHRMANVAFLVTSLSTGERHVVVTDENGRFSTESEVAAHTANTNRNDQAVDEAGSVVDESVLSWQNGVWFSGSITLQTEPDNDRGALPFDVYRFDELATSASYGHQLVSFEVAVRRDGTTVNAGTVSNRMIRIATTAVLATTQSDEGAPAARETIVDTVAYENLEVGASYELRGQLVDRATGELLADNEGNALQAVTAFCPSNPSGSVAVEFAVDTSLLAGTRITVIERLFLGNQEVASHVDTADDQQTVSIVELATTATGLLSGTHEESCAQRTVLKDAVSYTGLTAGRTYEVCGTLVFKDTGEPVLDNAGKPIEATREFVAEAATGTIELEFVFDATELAGRTVVAFEELRHDGITVATHADLADRSQSVALVKIATKAHDKASGSQSGITAPDAVVIDEVSFAGLEVGATYTLEGALVNKANGAAILDARKNAVTVVATFEPTSPTGSLTLEFPVDTSDFDGRSIVVFETLLRDGAVVASHADLNDGDQTVSWYAPAPLPPLGESGESLLQMALALSGAIAVTAGVAACTVLCLRYR